MADFMYWTISVLGRIWYKLFYGMRLVGRENIPKEGGMVMCLNHISWRDPIYLCACLPRRMHALAKKELFQKKLVAKFMHAMGAIPVDRGTADMNAMRTSFKLINEGGGLVIFPQGTRSRDNTPTPFHGGSSMIALRCGAPVIPAYIDGPYKLFHRCEVRVGAPIDLSDLGRRCDSETLAEATRRIETAVWALRDAEDLQLNR